MKMAEDIDGEALELSHETMDLLQQVTNDVWTVAGHCAKDPEAEEAFDRLVEGLHALLGDGQKVDPEIVQLGLAGWLHESRSHLNQPDESPRREAG